MKTLKTKLLIITCVCLICLAKAQDKDIIELKVIGKDSIPTFIIFKNSEKSFKKGQEKDVFKEYLKLTGNDELIKVNSKDDELGFTHERYQQYYKGLKVEFAEYKVHLKDNQVESINGDFKRIGKIDISPKISEEIALQKALDYTGANEYMWEIPEMEEWIKKENNDPNATLYPKAELTIIENSFDNQELCLAYKFNIYANDPISREYIYIDANNGNIINIEPILTDYTETKNAATRYSELKHIDTYYLDGYYRLRDYSSSRGNGVEVWNMNNQLGFNNITDFKDSNNIWTAEEWNNPQKDNAALDALWAAQKTYDYFWETFGRNSFDDLGSVIKCYVHWHVNYDRATWDSNNKHLTCGDGGTKNDALTAIDGIAHEIAHGLNNSESNLRPIGLSGALKEGLGDIWGACVENFAAPLPEKKTWLIGEDIAKNGYCTRSMNNPNTTGNPDTYGDGSLYWYNQEGCIPTNTNDYCGIHINSTVIAHWFYLLSEGGKGVSGIGIENAAKIVYKMEVDYLTNSSKFTDARYFSLKSARDKFGYNSIQVIQTGKAWYAVGVGEYDFLPVITDSQIKGGSDYVSINSVNKFYVNPVSDSLTTEYSWSIIPYSMSCSSDKMPYFTVPTTGTTVWVNHGSCAGTYLLRCIAKNYWSSSSYQDRVITVYNPNGGGSGDPDPCDPVISIYPNPGKKNEFTTLKIQYPPPGDPCDDADPYMVSYPENEIRIYNLSGNLVLNKSFSADTYTFRNADFRKDIYIITLKDKKGKLHQKQLTIK